MTSIDIRLAETEAELERCAEVLLQLRSALGKEELLERIGEQQRHGYRVAYAESNGQVVCVAGFVTGLKLAWGKYLYVDDLVTAETHRSKGAGAKMIAWLKDYARQTGCDQLHLDSGVQRFAAHRFYLREGFEISSHHFALRGLMRDA